MVPLSRVPDGPARVPPCIAVQVMKITGCSIHRFEAARSFQFVWHRQAIGAMVLDVSKLAAYIAMDCSLRMFFVMSSYPLHTIFTISIPLLNQSVSETRSRKVQ